MYHRVMRFVEILLFCGLAVAGFAKPHAPFDRIYVFGDSYSDIGEGYLDGNGPTAVAYMAQDLGIELIRADKGASPRQSLDFAVSAAQTGRGDAKKMGTALLGFGMQNQVDDFASRVRDHKIRFYPEKTLFFIAGGLNDKKLPTQTTVDNLKNEVRELYKLGGRHFALALMPTAIPAFSEVGLRLNPAIALIPEQLKAELPAANIRLSHWGPFFDEVIHNPSQYGIQDTTHACAGREIFNEDTTPCATPDDHFYYHGGHPSTAVHKIVGAKLAQEIETDR
jgi:phospholipase/lecithinase/hemolysin